MNRPLLLAGLAAAIAPAFAAAAQAETPSAPAPTPLAAPTPAEDGRVIYPPSFFTEFSPQTALDMVARLPGFSIDGGDQRRGFAGTGGNVLINGERPSSKAQSATDLLSRINADRVERIELVRGAQSSEASGQAQVANVVLRAEAGEGGASLYELSLERADGGVTTPRGSVSTSGKIGDLEFNAGYSRYAEQRALGGSRLVTAPSGSTLSTRLDDTPRNYRNDRVTGQISAPLFGGKLQLNAEAFQERFQALLESTGRNPAGAITDSFRIDTDNRERAREFGGDWEREINGLTWKLIALDRSETDKDGDVSVDRNALGAITRITVQRRRDEEREQILRGAVQFSPAQNWSVEAGAEAALNSLDARLALTVDTGAGPVAVVLPSANVRVEEERAEPFVQTTWSADGWSVEGTLAWETSTISQSGDANASRTLSYWKPSLQVSRAFGEANQVRVRLFRQVGQLNFNDFAAASAQADDRVAAGNPNIVPPTEWRLEGTADWRWGEGAALSVTAYQRWVQDVADNVPIGAFDGPGNIGDGEAAGLEVKLGLPLDSVVPGGRLDVSGELRTSTVRDPVTRRDRSFSGFPDSIFEVSFRQDIAPWKMAWGGSYSGVSETEQFRRTEIDRFQEGPFLEAFVETTALPAKVRLSAFNINDATFRRQRNFFAPDRAGSPSRTELRKRHFGPIVALEISGRF